MAAGKNIGTAKPTYKKEDIKTYEIPKNMITRTIIAITNLTTTTKRNR